MRELDTEILIVGGGLGGVAAALAALRAGRTVILTEETNWVGGQLTAQGVPPDENPWIDSEGTGCTASYRLLREGIRETYRRYYPLTDAANARRFFNPGMGNVSPLCHEPAIAHSVIRAMLAPYQTSQRLTILLRCVPVAAECDGDRITSVTMQDVNTGDQVVIAARYVLDATELGDLLELANVEHVTGAESQAETAEPHALPGDADPLDQQSISWCFAVDYHLGEDFTIARPAGYDFWRGYQAPFWPAPQLSWTTSDPVTLEPVTRPMFTGPTDDAIGSDLWHYRRILYRKYYPDGFYPSDVVVVNWPQIDYWLKPAVGPGVDAAARKAALDGARSLSLAMLYWMQTEAPRPDGGAGYPGLRPRGDLLGSSDEFAQAPYVRESRRIRAEFTVLEQHVGVEARGSLRGAEPFADTVGIGSYRIDLHPSYRRNYVDITNWPFQIPLGALIPVRVENLLPACKNLGVTHITNGCYRLHPVEWNIGEAAGALAAYCLAHSVAPRAVRGDATHLADFQRELTVKHGFVLQWPDHLRLTPRDKMDPLGI
ncbi:MAG: FAD-dependent oxidoreductase [Chloroflexi bacterium]|nr:FAD-dependent oxidoreductase [Chloroflexota bacterium]